MSVHMAPIVVLKSWGQLLVRGNPEVGRPRLDVICRAASKRFRSDLLSLAQCGGYFVRLEPHRCLHCFFSRPAKVCQRVTLNMRVPRSDRQRRRSLMHIIARGALRAVICWRGCCCRTDRFPPYMKAGVAAIHSRPVGSLRCASTLLKAVASAGKVFST